MNERRPHSDMHRKQRAKNWALLLALFAFIALIYLVTIVRMGGQ
jgi:uncharacterized Tic20 family protein